MDVSQAEKGRDRVIAARVSRHNHSRAFSQLRNRDGIVISMLMADSHRSRVILVLALLSGASDALAADIKGSLGWIGFADEGVEGHVLAGASLRYPLTRRFAIEPEVLYLRGEDGHYDAVLMPNLVWQWGRRRVRPYVTGGVGLIHSKWTSGSDFTTNTTFVSGGFGTKVYLDDRWFVAPEVRIGWEFHVRFSASLGYTWRP